MPRVCLLVIIQDYFVVILLSFCGLKWRVFRLYLLFFRRISSGLVYFYAYLKWFGDSGVFYQYTFWNFPIVSDFFFSSDLFLSCFLSKSVVERSAYL